MKNLQRYQRGFSIAEVLTVSVICGMLLTAMAIIVPAVLSAPRQLQSQVDDVNTAAIALYKIRRDFSESDTTGVLGCTTTPLVSCASYTVLTPVMALAVASPDNGSGQFVDQITGYPNWQGIIVYWLVPNASGTAYDIMRAYIGPPTAVVTTGPGGVPVIKAVDAQAAVTAAMLISPPPVLSNYITNMSVGVDPVTNIVQFSLTAGTTSGSAQSSTKFWSNTYARN